MELDVINSSGKKVSKIQLNESVFEGRVNKGLLQETVKMQQACRRAGTASTKTRGEVRGSGAKPWKQKGTGRARVGTKSNPIWRSGGIAFGPKPRDYSYSMPKKAVASALKSALRFKLEGDSIKVLDSLEIAEPKTKLALEAFTTVELKNALVVIDSKNVNLMRATKNLQNFKLLEVKALNVFDILRYDELVFTKSALEKIEGMLGKAV
ncbi:MAG: 50S ribosomal protein L4 [Deltaproteobacteria bacterium]|nr:50S ribosomal protein L4 [Deltaproteobacteria bacterium]